MFVKDWEDNSLFGEKKSRSGVTQCDSVCGKLFCIELECGERFLERRGDGIGYRGSSSTGF